MKTRLGAGWGLKPIKYIKIFPDSAGTGLPAARYGEGQFWRAVVIRYFDLLFLHIQGC